VPMIPSLYAIISLPCVLLIRLVSINYIIINNKISYLSADKLF